MLCTSQQLLSQKRLAYHKFQQVKMAYVLTGMLSSLVTSSSATWPGGSLEAEDGQPPRYSPDEGGCAAQRADVVSSNE